MKQDYHIKTKPISKKNPQANAILERVHQVLGNLCRTFELENREIDKKDPWTGILAATAWAIQSTYHTTLQATPGQLVFGRDMILPIEHIANQHNIEFRKQLKINQSNLRENKKRIEWDYQPGDKVLMKCLDARKLERQFDGPYELIKVHTNGTVTLKRGAVTECINIRRIYPFCEQSNWGSE